MASSGEDDLRQNLIKVAGEVLKGIEEMKESVEGLVTITFPEIVVIGDEGHGKSSLLERLAMMELFPIRKRDPKTMMTRMPIKLSLKYLAPDDFRAFCAERGLECESKIASRVMLKGRYDHTTPWVPLNDEKDTRKLVEENMNNLIRHENDGKLSGISDEDAFIIEVVSPDVPNLMFIDLPGIVAARRKGESKTISEETEELVRKYLRRPHTLYLVVQRANERLRSSRAIKLLQDHGKEDIALCVLTFCDDSARTGYKDPYGELKKRLRGESEDSIELPNGYVGVINRDTRREEGGVVELKDSAEEERKWFKKNTPELMRDEPTVVTITSVSVKVTEMLLTYLRDTWSADAQKAIDVELQRVHRQLELLGVPVTEDNAEEIVLSVARECVEMHDRIIKRFDYTREGRHPPSMHQSPSRKERPYAPYEAAVFRHKFLRDVSLDMFESLKSRRCARDEELVAQLSRKTDLPLNISRFHRVHERVRAIMSEICPADAPTESWDRDYAILEVLYRSGVIKATSDFHQRAHDLAKQTFYERLMTDRLKLSEDGVVQAKLAAATASPMELLEESEKVREERNQLNEKKRKLEEVRREIERVCALASK